MKMSLGQLRLLIMEAVEEGDDDNVHQGRILLGEPEKLPFNMKDNELKRYVLDKYDQKTVVVAAPVGQGSSKKVRAWVDDVEISYMPTDLDYETMRPKNTRVVFLLSNGLNKKEGGVYLDGNSTIQILAKKSK
jgi:hypothetical protein